jgi:subtilisin family serine protease
LDIKLPATLTYTVLRVWVPLGLTGILAACGGGGSSSAPPPPLPPVVFATATAPQGHAPLAVNFDASQSTDPQSFALTYTWTFGDGSTGTGKTVTHTYQNHGSYSATVAVNDGHNTTTSSPLFITVAPAPPTVQPTAVSVSVLGVAPTTTLASVSATDRENLTLTYSIATQPSVGTATINANTGAITYSLAGYPSATTDSFSVNVANLGASATGTVSVALNSDPLLTNQWHIQNTGQNAFSTTLPVAGNDMNVTPAWVAGFSGKGIKVAVVDSGLEAAHEDLAANVDLTHSWNFVTGTNDPTQASTYVGEDHGTQVAGIIGAVAFNGKGGRGVAFNATLRGYNLLQNLTTGNFGISFGSDPISADNDVFNASFETVPSGAQLIPIFSATYSSIMGNIQTTLRNGLGGVVVDSAGNDFAHIQNDSNSTIDCQFATAYGVSCGDPAHDERLSGNVPIIVSATNAAGKKASYSTTGSSVWVSAPGGEYGWDTTLTIGLTPFSYAAAYVSQPAVITTSRDGCPNALILSPSNLLDDQGSNPFATNCQYTAEMNGTSSAAPNTSATVALMLEANPQLTSRDVKYILAKTAKKIDSGFIPITATNLAPGSTVTLEQGWVANAAGFTFNNWYGFGEVDAGAAVNAAKSYTTFLTPEKNSQLYQTDVTNTLVPHASAVGLQKSFTVTDSFLAETVQLFVYIDSTPLLSCNQIELLSPSGTKSILLHAASGMQNTAVVQGRFLSNAFYGESVAGVWTATFLDFCGADSSLSAVNSQLLLLSGH